MTNKALSIFNQLRPLTVGFDDTFRHFESMFDHQLDHIQTTDFPHYNIVKQDKNKYDIQIALAGYNKKDIEVKYADNTITIKSTHKDEEDKDTIHRGIAKRHFTRSFTTADDVEVRGAEMKDGMLSIALEKILPEGKKPRTIEIA